MQGGRGRAPGSRVRFPAAECSGRLPCRLQCHEHGVVIAQVLVDSVQLLLTLRRDVGGDGHVAAVAADVTRQVVAPQFRYVFAHQAEQQLLEAGALLAEGLDGKATGKFQQLRIVHVITSWAHAPVSACNRSNIVRHIVPGWRLPTAWTSMRVTGKISRVEEVIQISSACFVCSTVRWSVSVQGRLLAAASSSMAPRVMPGRISSRRAGVTMPPSSTAKTLLELPSSTQPSRTSRASSAPAACAAFASRTLGSSAVDLIVPYCQRLSLCRIARMPCCNRLTSTGLRGWQKATMPGSGCAGKACSRRGATPRVTCR